MNYPEPYLQNVYNSSKKSISYDLFSKLAGLYDIIYALFKANETLDK